MSCWMCSNQHIAALVGSFMAMKSKFTEAPDPQALARTLYDQNMRSVDHRYSHNAEMISESVAYKASHPISKAMIARWQKHPLTPGQFFKTLDCYEYQASESSDWERTAARKLCGDMRDAVCCHVADYEATPWGLDAPPPLLTDEQEHERATETR